MIGIALRFLIDQLVDDLGSRTGSTGTPVIATRLVDDSGKTLVPEDGLGISVINIEEDRVMRSQLPEATLVGGRHVYTPPDLRLNLHLLVAANFRQYDQALRYLSHVLLFFHNHPVFTPESHPGLDPALERLTIELLSLNYEQINQIWASVGGKQLPSAVYKLRAVILTDGATGIAEPIRDLRVEAHGR